MGKETKWQYIFIYIHVFSAAPTDVKNLNPWGTNFSKDIRRPPPPSTPQEVPMCNNIYTPEN